MDSEVPYPDVMARLAESISAQDQELGKWREALHAELASAEEPVSPPDHAPEEGDQKPPSPQEANAKSFAALEASFAAQTEQIESLKQALSETEERLHTAETMLEQRNAQLSMLAPALAERDDRIQALQIEIHELRTQGAMPLPPGEEGVDQLSLACAEAKAHAAALEADLRDEREHAAMLETTLRQTRERLDAAQAEIDRLRGAQNPAREPARSFKLDDIEAFDVRGHKKRIGQILLESGVINAYQLNELLNQQTHDPKRRFGALVVEKGFTSEYVIARILAAQLRLPFSELRDEEIDPEAFALVAGHLARTHRCVPMRKRGNSLVLAMANPLDLIAIEDVEMATGCRVEPVVATAASIDFAISRHSIHI